MLFSKQLTSTKFGMGFKTNALSPWRFGVVLLQWVELLLHPLPALQTAPQPVRVDNLEVFAALCLANLLGAWVPRMSEEKGQN